MKEEKAKIVRVTEGSLPMLTLPKEFVTFATLTGRINVGSPLSIGDEATVVGIKIEKGFRLIYTFAIPENGK